MIKHTLLASALACLSFASPARAQDLQAAREACMPDYKRYCAGALPGGGRVKKCLIDNLDKLAPVCKAAVVANAGTPPRQK